MDWGIADGGNATSFEMSTNLTTNDSIDERLSRSFRFHTGMPSREQINIPMAIVLVVCICVSSLGNGAVLYIAVLKMKRSSLVRLNLLISSLALSDFLQTFTLMIPQLLRKVFGEWTCGILICKLHTSMRYMQTNVSISILALITLERFVYLDRVSNGFENKSMYITVNVVIWCVHIGLAAPLGVWSTVVMQGTTRTCTIPSKVIPMTEEYVLFGRNVFFYFPLVLMWICNIGIIYKTRKSSLSVRPLQTNGQPYRTTHNREDRERRTILTCLALATVFTVTMVPFESCLFALKSATDLGQITRVTTLMTYFWPLTLLNPCINPFIYSVFFKQFRQKVKAMIRCSKCKHYCCNKVSTPRIIQSISSRTTTDQSGSRVNQDRHGIGTYNPYGNDTNNQRMGSIRFLSSSGCGIGDNNMPTRPTDRRTAFATGEMLSPTAISTSIS